MSRPISAAVFSRWRLWSESTSQFVDFAVAFTPKELCLIAQGRRASRLPWVRVAMDSSTLKGNAVKDFDTDKYKPEAPASA